MGLSNSLIDGGFYHRLGKLVFHESTEEENCLKYDNGSCDCLTNSLYSKTLTESEAKNYQRIICRQYPDSCILNQKNKTD